LAGAARLDHAIELEMTAFIEGREAGGIRIGVARPGEQDEDIVEVVRPIAEIVRTRAAGAAEDTGLVIESLLRWRAFDAGPQILSTPSATCLVRKMCFALCALLLAWAWIGLVMSCRYFNHRKIVGNECDRAHNCPCFLGSTPPPSMVWH
jgi:hypothetical protein